MPLTLRVVSAHRKGLGEQQTMTIGPEGATIGRSLDNDWVLPDENRYISSRHATVDYQSNAYYLIDTSTNGVYINGSETPVGAGKPQRLFNGDKLSIGDYEIVADIVESEDDEKDAIEEMIESVVLDRVEEAPDIESPSMVEENALTGEKSLNARLFGETVQHTNTVAADSRSAESNVIAFEANSSEARAETGNRRQSKAAGGGSKGGIPAGGKPVRELDAAEIAFLNGLGLSVEDLGYPETRELMHNAGRALREFIFGMMDLLQTRAGLKNTFRLEQTTIQAGRNNPLKFTASAEDAIRNLLVGKKKQYVATVETIREACEDVKRHEEALAAAMRTAFDEFVDRLEPQELQTRFDASMKRGSMFGGNKKSRYWELYGELYEVMTQRSPGQFPHVFSEEFVKAYDEYLTRTKQTRAGKKNS